MQFDIDLENSSYVYESETLEDALFRTVAVNLTNKASKMLDDKLQEAVAKKVDEVLNEKIEDILDNFMEKPVVVSNGYKKEEYNSVLEMVEQRFTASYQTQLNGGCSTENPLIAKMTSHLNSVMRKYTDKIEKTLKTEASRIAREELEKTNLSKLVDIKSITS